MLVCEGLIHMYQDAGVICGSCLQSIRITVITGLSLHHQPITKYLPLPLSSSSSSANPDLDGWLNIVKQLKWHKESHLLSTTDIYTHMYKISVKWNCWINNYNVVSILLFIRHTRIQPYYYLLEIIFAWPAVSYDFLRPPLLPRSMYYKPTYMSNITADPISRCHHIST